uniref:Putative GH57: related to a-amylase n=1 Tax=Magnetococcus massalia (strain MO-1) TaxID=451514 RepID=A0A1S7LC96_MAGMO|nr:putative GH57 : related to a-amylase [Candidatus Magnetococcus massalia]
MSLGKRFHALGLHMHQPPGNLKLLLEQHPWEAEQIIQCYARPPRYAKKYQDIATFHVGFSGTLLEQLLDPEIQAGYADIIDIPAMLQSWREAENIELLGMGYFHPLMPLIPQQDWAEQVVRGRQMIRQTFGRAPEGFWPAEMAFSMAMIPTLVEAGYRYVVVDGVHLRPEQGSDEGQTDIYTPYLATYEGQSITVVPRDRNLSNAQESGLDTSWLANEVIQQTGTPTAESPPQLITTWSDGENGGWFRQMDETAGFWGHFFSPCMEHCRSGEFPMQPTSLSQFLSLHPAKATTQVETGAWNVADTSGMDFSQWAGSDGQKQGVSRLHTLAYRYDLLKKGKARRTKADKAAMTRAYETLLKAETSCYLFWGDAWLPQLHTLLDDVTEQLSFLEAHRAEQPTTTKRRATESSRAKAAPKRSSSQPSSDQPLTTPAPRTVAKREPTAAKGQKTTSKPKTEAGQRSASPAKSAATTPPPSRRQKQPAATASPDGSSQRGSRKKKG